jgi:hypothetical protein
MMQQQKQGDKWSNKDSFNLLWVAANCQAACVTVFTRTSFGAESLGVPGIGAFVVLCFWVAGTKSPDLMWYSGCWLCAWVLQRVKTMNDCRKGHYEHSRYGGYPQAIGRFCKSERWAKLVEGLGILLLGLGLNPIDWRLGHFFTASGGAILFIELIHGQVERKQRQERMDAEIEMRWLSNQGKEVMNHG